MPAYFVVNIEVTNKADFKVYAETVAPVIAQYGGRYVLRAPELHKIEGDFDLKRLVILEFPTMDAARTFYDSPEYAPLLKLRLGSTKSHMVLAEGFVAAES
jgi:uncharacterized protein (DUF1330 family)